MNQPCLSHLPYYFQPDLHLGSTRKNKLFTRSKNFEDLLLQNVSKLPQESTLFVLGDLCYEEDLDLLEEYIANCTAKTIILIRGNHDLLTDFDYYLLGFDVVCETFYTNGLMISHHPLPENQLPLECVYNIHGHLHSRVNHYGLYGNPEKSNKHVLLSLESDGYEPLSLAQIKQTRNLNPITPQPVDRSFIIHLHSDSSKDSLDGVIYHTCNSASRRAGVIRKNLNTPEERADIVVSEIFLK